jgi:methionyl-tRNA formyltransferase
MEYPKIVFFGTPDFAARILQFLVRAKVPVVGVVTQPDRPKGRNLQLTPSPVKQVAGRELEEIPVFQPQKASEPLFLSALKELRADLYIVVAFGQILPQTLLDIPPLGCINVHASLLPKYRGAAPIHRALMQGETKTGIAIQKMVKQLDAGDVIREAEIAITEEMTFGELEGALCELAKGVLLQVVGLYQEGIPLGKAQEAAGVTYASKITQEEAKIDWGKSAREIHNLVRALNPRPGAWSWLEIGKEKKRLKICRTEVSQEAGAAGKVIKFSVKEIVVGCGSWSLVLKEVQPEGKSKMSVSDWMRGLKNFTVESCSFT